MPHHEGMLILDMIVPRLFKPSLVLDEKNFGADTLQYYKLNGTPHPPPFSHFSFSI